MKFICSTRVVFSKYERDSRLEIWNMCTENVEFMRTSPSLYHCCLNVPACWTFLRLHLRIVFRCFCMFLHSAFCTLCKWRSPSQPRNCVLGIIVCLSKKLGFGMC